MQEKLYYLKNYCYCFSLASISKQIKGSLKDLKIYDSEV